jgi:hypothetical protein
MTNEAAALHERLAHERDAFQRNSLLRAMCDAQDDAASVQFMRELDGSAIRRALNRGYFLRRFGAVMGLLTEPLPDAPDVIDWSAARQAFLDEARESRSRSDRRPLPDALDLYTFFDFCLTRGEQIHGQDGALLASLADALWNERQIPVEIAARLLSLAAICTTAH